MIFNIEEDDIYETTCDAADGVHVYEAGANFCKCGREQYPAKPIEIPYADGKVSSSPCPAFILIPTEAMIRLAARFKLGEERKGDKAWNALSNNQDALENKDWILERINHVIHHCLKLRDKIKRDAPIEGDDDAAAIAWSGMFLCCATKALDEKIRRENVQTKRD